MAAPRPCASRWWRQHPYFNEAQAVPLPKDAAPWAENLVVVGATLDDHVDLDERPTAGVVSMPASTSSHRKIHIVHAPEHGVVQAIQAHGHGPDRVFEGMRPARRQQGAVGRERQLGGLASTVRNCASWATNSTLRRSRLANGQPPVRRIAVRQKSRARRVISSKLSSAAYGKGVLCRTHPGMQWICSRKLQRSVTLMRRSRRDGPSVSARWPDAGGGPTRALPGRHCSG